MRTFDNFCDEFYEILKSTDNTTTAEQGLAFAAMATVFGRVMGMCTKDVETTLMAKAMFEAVEMRAR
jgi:hypothetical protein